MRSTLKRDEEAVSAAVATVLMFGGVLSIIGIMMVSMIPVIEELEGSVERHDMSSQMSLLAHQTSALSEKGMPGDSTSIELIPVDGSLEWQHLQSGMWYAATWHEDMSFRMRGALNFDDELEVRHPESVNTALCIDDLRLGPANPYYYTVPDWAERVLFTVAPGLAIPLGPVDVDLIEGGEATDNIQLRVDGMHEIDASDYQLFSPPTHRGPRKGHSNPSTCFHADGQAAFFAIVLDVLKPMCTAYSGGSQSVSFSHQKCGGARTQIQQDHAIVIKHRTICLSCTRKVVVNNLTRTHDLYRL